jgi:hypothetical protein
MGNILIPKWLRALERAKKRERKKHNTAKRMWTANENRKDKSGGIH